MSLRHFRSRRWLGASLTLAIVAVALFMFTQNKAASTPKPEAPATPATLEFSAVDVALVEHRPLNRRIAVSGNLATPLQAQIKPKVAGQVLRVHVREGDSVRRGQVLVQLDTADLRARLDAAIADQQERQARLQIAKTNRDNNQTLLQRNFISRNALDQTESTFQAALAALRWAEAQVRLAQSALDDAVVVAPFAGQVARRLVNDGERVAPDTPLLQIVDLAQLELDATVPVADVPRLRLGQHVGFRVDGFSGREFAGSVARINPVAEANSRAIRVFSLVPNADLSLRGGMFATGAIDTGGGDPAPIVPATAVFEEAGQRYVFVIARDKLAKRAVRVIGEDDATGQVALDGDLPTGLPVVRVRMNNLRDGAPATLKATAS